MKITIEGITYDFDETTTDNRELIAIERATGLTVAQWSTALSDGSMLALTALVWILRRRAGEGDLAFEDVTFHPAAIEVQDDEQGKD